MGLIIPHSHKIHQKPPQYACTLCEAVFTEDERHQYERHVLSHPLEEVQAQTLSHQAPGIFGDKGSDLEWAKWVEDHRRTDPQGLQAHKWLKTDAGKHSSGIGDG